MAKTGKQQRWPKEAIRKEILRLDGITGLRGADVTIRLYTEPEPIGCFTFIDPVRMTFGFSSSRFEDPKFTNMEALDVIRHEYAHFMEYRLFGESTDHGPNWKKCCGVVGARPDALYTNAWKEKARQETRKLNQKTSTTGYTIGTKIKHPAFGEGIIENITRQETITKLTVRFESCTKILDVAWVRANCK